MLAPDDLLRDPVYRRLWFSIVISSLGQQVTMLAIPLTAAVLLQATPTQMGLLVAMELAPFVLLSLPVGVWLDRVRKLPVYLWGQITVAVVLATVPLAWWLGHLGMAHLYAVMFAIGCVFVSSGSASQIVLTQVVPRERLVEAHAKNALASSGAEVVGPGLAGMLIKLVGAPFALLADGCLLLFSVLILRGLRVTEHLAPAADRHFGRDLREGLNFVRHHAQLPLLALVVGVWQFFQHAAMVTHILLATRELGLTEQQVGLSYIGLGAGAVLAGSVGHRISARWGPGRTLGGGILVTGLGWLLLAALPAGPWGVAGFVAMLLCFSAGAVLLFINFLAVRQAVTPAPLLGRMTSIMRWLILIPAGPGALLGGWLGEHAGLRVALGFGGAGALLLGVWVWVASPLRHITRLPKLETTENPVHKGVQP